MIYDDSSIKHNNTLCIPMKIREGDHTVILRHLLIKFFINGEFQKVFIKFEKETKRTK